MWRRNECQKNQTRKRSCYRSCCRQWLWARLQLSRASVSLEVDRGSADLCCSRLIATTSIVDYYHVFLENVPRSLRFSSVSDMVLIYPGKSSSLIDAQDCRHPVHGACSKTGHDAMDLDNTATQIYAPTYQPMYSGSRSEWLHASMLRTVGMLPCVG